MQPMASVSFTAVALNIYSLTEKTLYLSLANQKQLFLEEIRAWTLARWSPLACIWIGWERSACFFSLGQEFFPLRVAVARQPAKCQDVKHHISLCIVYSDGSTASEKKRVSVSVLKRSLSPSTTPQRCNNYRYLRMRWTHCRNWSPKIGHREARTMPRYPKARGICDWF